MRAAPPAAANQSRTVGIVALVLALLPIALYAFTYVTLTIASGLFPDNFSDYLLPLVIVCSVLTLVALALGIVAARTDRGRIVGVVAISIGAAVLLLPTPPFLVSMISSYVASR